MPLRQGDLIPDRALESSGVDLLDHSAVAGRVAELVTQAETPLAVALFGPWGSGKSSISTLIKRALPTAGGIKFIRYDAWAFAGEPLMRNFLSHSARALGYEDDGEGRPFMSGLYQSRRSVDLDLKRLDVRRVVELGLVLALAATAIAAVIALVSSLLFHIPDPVGTFLATAPGWFSTGAVLGGLGTVIKQAVDKANVQVEQSAPTQELFHLRFRELMELARKQGNQRVVFFVDELDRCAKKDVVEVLATIRSFFDVKDCVFVVAADRQVLEEALRALPQSTPANIEEPYYSSASAFLDKIFQHQISLPPIRFSRLDLLARKFVEGSHNSVWGTLRQTKPDDAFLDDVLFVLLPSHLSSPRRVKVLMNNFATNARIAEARGFDWVKRAEEIAKLTVLETEFPALAADLRVEPRLPALLMEQRTETDNLRLLRLLSQHRLPRADGSMPPPPVFVSSVADAAEAETEALMPSPLVPTTSLEAAMGTTSPGQPDLILAKRDVFELAVVQRLQLRSYLARTSAIPGPGRDLIFLEHSGSTVEMDDPGLGDWIDTTAVDAPDDVFERLRLLSVSERQKAVRLLGHTAFQASGRESENVERAALLVARSLDGEFGPAGRSVNEILSSVTRSAIEDSMLPVVLDVASRVSPKRSDIVERVLRDERLLESPAATAEVAASADIIDKPQRQPVWAAVARHLSADHSVVMRPLRGLPDPVAEEMLISSAVMNAIGAEVERLADGEAAEIFANALVDAASAGEGPRSRSTLRAAKRLVFPSATETSYGVLLERANGVFDAARPNPEIAQTAMLAIESPHSEVADWEGWAARIEDGAPPTKYHAAQAADTLVALFTRHDEVDAPKAIERVARRVAPFGLADPAGTKGVALAIGSALSARNYWASSAVRVEHVAVTRGALSVASTGLAASQIEAAVEADLARGYSRPLSIDSVQTYEDLADDLPMELAKSISGQLSALTMADPVEDAIRLRARVALVRRLRTTGEDIWSLGPAGISRPEIQASMTAAGPARDSLAIAWLELDPIVEDVAQLVIGLGASANRAIGSGVVAWASRHTPSERAQLSIAVLTVDAPSWLRDLLSLPMPEESVIPELALRIEGSTKWEDRRDYARMIEWVSPSDSASFNRIAALVTWLLSRDKDSDDRTALDLVRLLPLNAHTARAMQGPLVAALGRGIDLRRADREHIALLGIRVPRRFRDLFGR